ALETIFEVKNVDNYLKVSIVDNDDTDFYDKINNLKSMTENLYKEYERIVNQYIDSGEIYYSKTFLNLNEKCGSKRRMLENEYPTLKSAYDVYSEKNIEENYNLKFEKSVGTGITHIQKFYTLDLYLKEINTGPSEAYMDINIFYSPRKEYFYIETDDYDEAIGCAYFIEKSINTVKSANDHIGKVTINPKYESIKFEGELTEITYTIVYPNGDEPGKRNDILTASRGKQQTTTLYGTNGEPLRQEPNVDEVSNKGNKGYLRNLVTKGAKMVRTILRVDTLP